MSYLYHLPDDQGAVEEAWGAQGVRCAVKFLLVADDALLRELVESLLAGQKSSTANDIDLYRTLAWKAFRVCYYRAYRDLTRNVLSRGLRKRALAYPEKKSDELRHYVRRLLDEQAQLEHDSSSS